MAVINAARAPAAPARAQSGMHGAPGMLSPGPSVRLGTLNNLRWLAVVGQTVSLLVVNLVLNLHFPVLNSAAVIGASAVLNVILAVAYPSTKRLTSPEATAFLPYDIAQLAVLLFFTGGIENPFALLFFAPVGGGA